MLMWMFLNDILIWYKLEYENKFILYIVIYIYFFVDILVFEIVRFNFWYKNLKFVLVMFLVIILKIFFKIFFIFEYKWKFSLFFLKIFFILS